MTIASVVPEVWAARFLNVLQHSLVWGGRCNTEYEGEISQAGDTVHIPKPGSTVTIKDYVKGTALEARQAANPTVVDLVINKAKYWNLGVEDMDRVQSKPDLMESLLREAAYDMRDQIDQDVRTIFANGYNSARRIANLTDDYQSAAQGKALLGAFIDAKKEFSDMAAPEDDRWAVVGTSLINSIEHYFLTNSADGIYFPATPEQTLRNGFSGRLLTFNLYVSHRPLSTGSGNTLVERATLGFGNEYAAHAMQLTEVEPYRPEDSFEDAVKGLTVYGSKMLDSTMYRFFDYVPKRAS